MMSFNIEVHGGLLRGGFQVAVLDPRTWVAVMGLFNLLLTTYLGQYLGKACIWLVKVICIFRELNMYVFSSMSVLISFS